jgi:hypothetical protein
MGLPAHPVSWRSQVPALLRYAPRLVAEAMWTALAQLERLGWHVSEHPDWPAWGTPGWAPMMGPNRLTLVLAGREVRRPMHQLVLFPEVK